MKSFLRNQENMLLHLIAQYESNKTAMAAISDKSNDEYDKRLTAQIEFEKAIVEQGIQYAQYAPNAKGQKATLAYLRERASKNVVARKQLVNLFIGMVIKGQ